MEYNRKNSDNNNTIGEDVVDMLKASYKHGRLVSWKWDFETKELCWVDENFEQKSSVINWEELANFQGLFGNILPEDALQVKERLDKMLDEPFTKFDYRFSVNGDVHLKGAVLQLEKDETGLPVTVRGTLQDITEQKHEVVYLRQVNAAFQQSEQLASLGNWHLNLSTKNYMYSGNLYEIFGVEKESFTPGFDSFRQFVHPEDKGKLLTNEDLFNHPDQPVFNEFRIIKAGGEIAHIKSISKVISNFYGERIVLGTIQDVTNEVHLMQHLEEKALLNQLIFDNSVDYVFACDKQLKITAWNRKCEAKYLLKKEEVLGKHIQYVFKTGEGELVTKDILHALEGEEVHREGKAEHEDTWYDRYSLPLKNTAGNIFGALCISHDLTAIKNVTNKLVELNCSLKMKNEMLEQSNNELASFSYVASHDLQEPLRKIQTFSSRIMEKEYQALSADGIEYFKRMESAAKRMQVLIDDLLTFSKTNTEQKEFQLVDLNDLINEVKSNIKEVIEDKQAIIKSDTLPVAKVIAFQFRQLVENLLLNSLKYNKPDVTPYISIRYKEINIDDNVTEDGLHPGVYHQVSVHDNGIGFEQEYNRKIFELFQRLHGKSEYPGTGLGLSICKRIAQNHGGTIVAEGTPGEGAVFTLYLPV